MGLLPNSIFVKGILVKYHGIGYVFICRSLRTGVIRENNEQNPTSQMRAAALDSLKNRLPRSRIGKPRRVAP